MSIARFSYDPLSRRFFKYGALALKEPLSTVLQCLKVPYYFLPQTPNLVFPLTALTILGRLLFYALRFNNIDLIWPIAFVGLSPLGHTLTQFMMP